MPPQSIIGFHHQQDDEEEEDGSESDYEGVGEYLERLVREEAEVVAAGSMQGHAPLLQGAMGLEAALGGAGGCLSATASSAAAAASAHPLLAGSGGGSSEGPGRQGSSAAGAGAGSCVEGAGSSRTTSGGGSGMGSGLGSGGGSSITGAGSGGGGGGGGAGSAGAGAGGHKRQRGYSVDLGDATLDEAGALLRSKEELFAMLKRCRETAKRHLERALAAEAEVAALRNGKR